jgi:hypothetical protein
MSAFNHLHKPALQGLGLLLGMALLVPAATLTVASAQMVGPMPPQTRQMPESGVTKALSKMFNKKKEASDSAKEDPKPEDKAISQPSAAPAKPHVSMPAPEEVKRPPMLTQPPLENAKIDPPQVDIENPPVMSHPKLDDPNNPLGLVDAQNRLKRLIALVDGSRFSEVKPAMGQLRQYLVDVTEAHIGLYKTLNQIPSARGQAELEKTLALEFAQLRDRAMVEMAKIYIAEKEYPKAVKELAEVVKSQPKSKLGLHSYELLQEIGFTEKLQLTQ